eukprot:1369508-Alexandrium_andersonii.AAC.1
MRWPGCMCTGAQPNRVLSSVEFADRHLDEHMHTRLEDEGLWGGIGHAMAQLHARPVRSRVRCFQWHEASGVVRDGTRC